MRLKGLSENRRAGGIPDTTMPVREQALSGAGRREPRHAGLSAAAIALSIGRRTPATKKKGKRKAKGKPAHRTVEVASEGGYWSRLVRRA